jgi:hypothetical protein
MAAYSDQLEEERRRGQLGALEPEWTGPTIAGEGNPYSPNYPDWSTSYEGDKPEPEAPKPPEPTPGYIENWAELFKPKTEPAPTGGGGGGGGGGGQPQFQAPAFQMPSFSSGGGGSSSNWTATGGTAKAPAITDEMTQILRDRLQQLKNPLDIANDPVYKAQVAANQVQTQRDMERQRAGLAQRAASRGALSSGGFNTGVRSLGEQQGRANQQYAANLAGERLQQREAQLNQAIAMARSVGQDDVATQLENLKLGLQTQALQLQHDLGFADIDLRRFLGEGNLQLGWGSLQNQMNRDSLLSIL